MRAAAFKAMHHMHSRRPTGLFRDEETTAERSETACQRQPEGKRSAANLTDSDGWHGFFKHELCLNHFFQHTEHLPPLTAQ